MKDKIIQISQDAEGNITGLGKSGTTYYAHRYKSEKENKMIWVKYIESPSIEESRSKL